MVIIPIVLATLSVFSQNVITREQFLSNPAVVSITETGEEFAVFFDCLSGNISGAWYESTDSYLVCPGHDLPYGGNVLLGEIEVTQRRTSRGGIPVDIPWVSVNETNYWMAFVASRGFDLWFSEDWCANLFPVVEESGMTGEWKSVIFSYELGKEECVPHIAGVGNIVVFVSPYSLSLKQTDLSEFSPPTSYQSVPSEVSDLSPVSFLPNPIRLGWGINEILSLISGGALLWLTGFLASVLFGK